MLLPAGLHLQSCDHIPIGNDEIQLSGTVLLRIVADAETRCHQGLSGNAFHDRSPVHIYISGSNGSGGLAPVHAHQQSRVVEIDLEALGTLVLRERFRQLGQVPAPQRQTRCDEPVQSGIVLPGTVPGKMLYLGVHERFVLLRKNTGDRIETCQYPDFERIRSILHHIGSGELDYLPLTFPDLSVISGRCER